MSFRESLVAEPVAPGTPSRTHLLLIALECLRPVGVEKPDSLSLVRLGAKLSKLLAVLFSDTHGGWKLIRLSRALLLLLVVLVPSFADIF